MFQLYFQEINWGITEAPTWSTSWFEKGKVFVLLNDYSRFQNKGIIMCLLLYETFIFVDLFLFFTWQGTPNLDSFTGAQSDRYNIHLY